MKYKTIYAKIIEYILKINMSEKISYNSSYTEQNTTKKIDSNFNATPFAAALKNDESKFEESVTKNKENIWFETKIKLKNIKIEVNNNDENIVKLNEISDKYNTSEELLRDPIARRKILELSFDSQKICPSLKFKNESKFINYTVFTDKIIEIEKKELKEILSFYKGRDGKDIDIEAIFSWDTCQPINLLKKIEGIQDQDWNLLSKKEKKDILSSVLNIKTYDFEKTLDIILDKNWLDKSELKDLSNAQVLEILNKKWVSEEKSKIIIENLKRLKLTKETESAIEKTDSLEDAVKVIENYNTKNEVEKYLEQNSKRFLKVVNDLNIYWVWVQINDINQVILSAEYAYVELLKHKNLNEDWQELLSILGSIIKINNETNTYKWEGEKNTITDKEIEKKENTYFENKLNNVENNYYITTENNYIATEWWYYLEWKNGEIIDWLIISEKEKKITYWDPKTTENLINFYNFFKELNLEGVWEYREKLALAMGDVDINLNDDSLKKSELLKFSKKLIVFLNNSVLSDWKQLKENHIRLSWVESELREITWAWSYFEWQTFDIEWEDIFTASMRSLWIIWWAYFNISKFRDVLNKKKS